MPATVSHALSMTTPDDPAYENQPKHWNSNHLFTLNAVGSEISGAFGNGGGVTFGLSADGKMTASAPGAAPSPVNFSAGGASADLGSVVFSNSNGVSFGLNGSTITASVNAGGGGGAAISAGANSQSTGTVVFSNSNNFTFGLSNNGVLTASFSESTHPHTAFVLSDSNGLAWGTNGSTVTGSYSQSTHSHSTAPAAFAAGTQTGTSGTIAMVNSNNFTFGMSGSTGITASFSESTHSHSTAPGAIAAGTQTATSGTVVFANSNGLTFGMSGSSQITGSYTQSTHPHSISMFAVGNTTGQSSSTAIDVSQLSFSGAGELSVGFSAGNIVMSANNDALTAFANSNTTQSSSGVLSVSSLNFAGAGGISVGISNGSVLISAPAGGGGTTNQTGPNIAAGSQTATSGTVVFSNSNGMVFGMSNQSVITASFNDQSESIFWRPNDNITTVGAPINGSASVIYCPIDHNMSASRFDLIASINVATAANTSSAAFLYSLTAAFYTLNGATLSSVSSITTQNEMRWQSNSTGSVTGGFFLSAPLSFNGVADKYWVAVAMSTRATGHTGAPTTSLGNTVSLMGVGSAIYGAFSVREPGANTANSAGWIYGLGIYSGTTNFSTIGLSNLTRQGTNAQRANIALRMLNV